MPEDNDLDKLFQDRANRKNQAINEKERQDAEHEAFKAKACAVIQEVIAPVLENLANDIRARGHESAVELQIKNSAYPTAHLLFGVADDSDSRSHHPHSKLSFSTDSQSLQIQVRTELWGKKGKEESGGIGSPNPSKKVDGVTPDWVKAQALNFIRLVLEHN